MRKHPRYGTPMIGIVGWKKSGKTTLAVRLIEVFDKRGFTVASVKHAHDGFQIDNGETDSARHRRAGAQQVAVVSARKWALISQMRDASEPDFEEIISALGPSDLIIVEGYKSASLPKIEARRTQSVTQRELAEQDPDIIAIAADHPVATSRLPVFSLDDIDAIADFIEQSIGPLKRRHESHDAREAPSQNESSRE